MAFDAAEGRIVLLDGGTWTFSGGLWSPLLSAGSAPVGQGTAMVYDAAVGGIILYTAIDGTGGPETPETWEYRGGSWFQLHPATSPCGLIDPGLAYDPAAGGVILSGGYETCWNSESNWTWSFQGGNWTLRTTTNRYDEQMLSMSFDSKEQYVLALLGPSGHTPASPFDTWSYQSGNWTRVNTGYPIGVFQTFTTMLVDDPADDGVVVFGCSSGSGFLDFTWIWSTWAPVVFVDSFEATPSELLVGHPTTLTTDAQYGNPPYRFVYAGLPPGCVSSNASALVCSPSEPGDFMVTVSVSDSAGRSASQVLTLVVVPPPLSMVVSTRDAVVCLGEQVSFKGMATGGWAPLSFDWKFGDGGVGNGSDQVVHTFQTTGTFQVLGRVSDHFNQSNLSTTVILVRSVPGCLLFGSAGIELTLSLSTLSGVVAAGVWYTRVRDSWRSTPRRESESGTSCSRPERDASPGESDET